MMSPAKMLTSDTILISALINGSDKRKFDVIKQSYKKHGVVINLSEIIRDAVHNYVCNVEEEIKKEVLPLQATPTEGSPQSPEE